MCKCPGAKGVNEGTDVGEGHKSQEPELVEAGLEYTHPTVKEAAALTLTLNNEAPNGVSATRVDKEAVPWG